MGLPYVAHNMHIAPNAQMCVGFNQPAIVSNSIWRSLNVHKSFHVPRTDRAIALSFSPQEDQRRLKSSRVVPQKLTKHQRLNDSSTVAQGLGDLFNFVTGSAAKVQIVLDEPANGLESPSCSSPFKIIVIAEAQSELKYNKVYLKVNCSEELDQYYISESEFNGYVTESISTVNLEIDVAGPGTLLAGERVQWEVEVNLPSGSLPGFQGKYVKNAWKVEAAIGTGLTGGANPSTGWKCIMVQP